MEFRSAIYSAYRDGLLPVTLTALIHFWLIRASYKSSISLEVIKCRASWSSDRFRSGRSAVTGVTGFHYKLKCAIRYSPQITADLLHIALIS